MVRYGYAYRSLEVDISWSTLEGHSRTTAVRVLGLLVAQMHHLTCSFHSRGVIWGKLPYLSEPQLVHLKNGTHNNIYLMRLMGGPTKVTYKKCFAPGPTQ